MMKIPLSPPKQSPPLDSNKYKVDITPTKCEVKSVKFVENSNEKPNIKKTKSKSNYSDVSKNNIIFTKPPSISNDKFYGSPKKSLPIQSSTGHIKSFSDRLKKNLSFDLETPSLNSTLNVTAQNGSSESSSQTSSNNELLSDSNGISASQNIIQNSHQQDYLFSPMKRLRLEESQLEKPSFIMDPHDLSIQVEKAIMSQQLNITVTPEFNDCLQLLNEAESKVHNRVPCLNKNNSLFSSESYSTTPSNVKSNDKHYSQQQQSNFSDLQTNNQTSVTNSKLINDQILTFKQSINGQLNTHDNYNTNSANLFNSNNLFRSRSVEPNLKN